MTRRFVAAVIFGVATVVAASPQPWNVSKETQDAMRDSRRISVWVDATSATSGHEPEFAVTCTRTPFRDREYVEMYAAVRLDRKLPVVARMGVGSGSGALEVRFDSDSPTFIPLETVPRDAGLGPGYDGRRLVSAIIFRQKTTESESIQDLFPLLDRSEKLAVEVPIAGEGDEQYVFVISGLAAAIGKLPAPCQQEYRRLAAKGRPDSRLTSKPTTPTVAGGTDAVLSMQPDGKVAGKRMTMRGRISEVGQSLGERVGFSLIPAVGGEAIVVITKSDDADDLRELSQRRTLVEAEVVGCGTRANPVVCLAGLEVVE